MNDSSAGGQSSRIRLREIVHRGSVFRRLLRKMRCGRLLNLLACSNRESVSIKAKPWVSCWLGKVSHSSESIELWS
jgi:hypothetical protein